MFLLFGSNQGAYAVDYEMQQGRLNINGSMFIGTAVRTEGRDTSLLPNVNSSSLGVTGTALGGRNRDDGDLNFKRGEPVSTVAKGYLALDFKWHNYGAVASGKAWYDYALAEGGRPWGNVQNSYAAGEPVSDSGALRRSKFNGAVSDNLYGYGSNQIHRIPVDWKVGYQKLEWGNRFSGMGGLRDLTPFDAPAAVRPGALREEETRIAIPAAFMRLNVTANTKAELFYQFHFEPNAPLQCGTFYSTSDYSPDGCDKAFVGSQSDPDALANGSYLKRSHTVNPSNTGQLGVAFKQAVDRWATEFGVYAAKFHSRSTVTSGIKSLRTGAPFIPGDPDNLNAQYFTDYPEDVRIFGLTFDTKMSNGSVFGEFSYRPNQPFSYNGIDMTNAFVSQTSPTTLRGAVDTIAPGAAFDGYERHKAVQLQLGVTQDFHGVLGATELNIGAEGVYKGVPDLPDPSIARFGRSELFGQAPVNGACPPPATSTQCSSDGYVSRDAWGYRLRGSLRYAKAVAGLDFIPSLGFGHDVSGWSGDQGIIEGRKFAIVSLRTKSTEGWTSEIAWIPTWGGTYNPLRDRSTAQASIGYQF